MKDLRNYLETAITAAKNAGQFLIDNKNKEKKIIKIRKNPDKTAP